MTSTDDATTTTAPDTQQKPTTKPWREWRIGEMALSVRVINELIKSGIETYGDLANAFDNGQTFGDLTKVTVDQMRDCIYIERKNSGELTWEQWRIDDFISVPGAEIRKLIEAGVSNWGQVVDYLKDLENPLGLTNGARIDLQSEIDEAINLEPDDQAEQAEIDEPPIKLTGYQPTPEELAEYDRKTVQLVGYKLQVVRAEERNWKSLHAEASAAKKSFEAAQGELNDLIEAREMQRLNGRQLTIDDIKPEPADIPLPLAESLTKDLWQQYPMTFERWERFGLTKSDIEKLNSGETKNHGVHPILVFGDITRFITPNPANPGYARTLKDFKGLGDKGYDRYQEAETKFWTWWNSKGMAEFAAEKGITNGPATLPGNDSPSGSESQPDDAGEPVETSTRHNPDIDPADVDTDAPRTPTGKRSRRKKQTA
jgi:hypothetical protein